MIALTLTDEERALDCDALVRAAVRAARWWNRHPFRFDATRRQIVGEFMQTARDYRWTARIWRGQV